MAWPLPRELILSAPQLTWDWDHESGKAKVKEYLERFRITEGRVVLMAKAEELVKLRSDAAWSKEPWYGTQYRVERFEDQFVELVRRHVAIQPLS